MDWCSSLLSISSINYSTILDRQDKKKTQSHSSVESKNKGRGKRDNGSLLVDVNDHCEYRRRVFYIIFITI